MKYYARGKLQFPPARCCLVLSLHHTALHYQPIHQTREKVPIEKKDVRSESIQTKYEISLPITIVSLEKWIKKTIQRPTVHGRDIS